MVFGDCQLSLTLLKGSPQERPRTASRDGAGSASEIIPRRSLPRFMACPSPQQSYSYVPSRPVPFSVIQPPAPSTVKTVPGNRWKRRASAAMKRVDDIRSSHAPVRLVKRHPQQHEIVDASGEKDYKVLAVSKANGYQGLEEKSPLLSGKTVNTSAGDKPSTAPETKHPLPENVVPPQHMVSSKPAISLDKPLPLPPSPEKLLREPPTPDIGGAVNTKRTSKRHLTHIHIGTTERDSVLSPSKIPCSTGAIRSPGQYKELQSPRSTTQGSREIPQRLATPTKLVGGPSRLPIIANAFAAAKYQRATSINQSPQSPDRFSRGAPSAKNNPVLSPVPASSKLQSSPSKPVFNRFGRGNSLGMKNNTGARNSNPFRDRNRAVSSPVTPTPAYSASENKAFLFNFDTGNHQSESKANHARDGQDRALDESSPKRVGDAQITPHCDNSKSRIPRASPASPSPSPTDGGGTKAEGKTPKLSPNNRSSIPLPCRLIQTTDKGSDNSGTPSSKAGRMFERADSDTIYEEDGFEVSNSADTPSDDEEPFYDSLVDVGEMLANLKVDSDSDRSNTLLPDGSKLKQLSKTAPSLGPQLKIAPDAEQVIMGSGTKAVKESEAKSRRRSGSRKESRLSTDSLFSHIAPKRVVNSHSMSSLRRIASKPDVNTTVDKKVKKIKSTDVRSTIVEPSDDKAMKHNPADGAGIGQMKMVSTNPFFNQSPVSSPQLKSFRERYASMYGSPYASQDGDKEAAADKKGAKDSHTGLTHSDDPEKQKDANTPVKSTDNLDRAKGKKEPTPSKKESPRKRSLRNITAPEHSPRKHSRQHATGHTAASKSKLNHTASNDETDTHGPAENDQGEKPDPLHKRGRLHTSRHHATTEGPDKRKPSTTRGVLSNFRGLFMKPKGEAAKEPPTPEPQSASKRKDSEKARALRHSTLNVTTRQLARFDGRRSSSLSRIETRGRRRARSPSEHGTPVRETLRSAGLTDTAQVSSLTMEILDSARREENTSKKEKLIRLGKILIEAVNHSHDAEKAMLKAVQAAKEAEIACALAKENAMKMGQVARDWTLADRDDDPNF